MAGHDTGGQVSGFSCSRVKNSESKENFRAGDKNGKQDENDDYPGEICE